MGKTIAIIPIFVPHLGCPHQCSFCDQHQITGAGGAPEASDITERILNYRRTVSSGTSLEIAFYGGSFTMLPPVYQEQLLQPAYQALNEGLVRRIRISTRPDGINDDILAFLRSWGVSIVELGVQSLDPEVLRLCHRGHTAEQSLQASELVQKADFQLGVQLMVGLPGDTREKALETARRVAAMRPDFVRIYPALVLKGTGLESLFRRGAYRPLSLGEAADLTADLLMVFAAARIHVIRVGLQPNEALLSGDTLIAGPFHPSFRELAESEIMRRQIVHCLSLPGAGEIVKGRELTVFVSPLDLSRVKGEYGRNLEYLRTRYGFASIRVDSLPSLPRGDIGVAPGGLKVPTLEYSRQEFIASRRIH